jgi:phosphate transport system permease protein
VSATEAALGPRPRGDKVRGTLFYILLLVAVFVGFLLLGTLIVDVLRKGIGYLDPTLLTEPNSSDPEKAGAGPAIKGTIYMMVLLLVMVVPIGVGTAVYLEEYANRDRWYNRLLELNIQNLAAVPSIVYGILGLAFLVRGPLDLGHVVLAGGLTLGLLVLPMVIIAGREALRAVPPSIREGSMALGATQWQTIWRQVLPAAIPGIATGVILALSRAIGETAPLIVVGAVAVISFNPTGLDSQFTAMPIQIFEWISRASNDINNYKPLAAAGILLLILLLLAMNSVAIWLRNRYEQKW